jgi:hypothetical protein
MLSFISVKKITVTYNLNTSGNGYLRNLQPCYSVENGIEDKVILITSWLNQIVAFFDEFSYGVILESIFFYNNHCGYL